LDALAVHRRELGLPGVSLAWGMWEQRSGMTGHLGRTELDRMRRVGQSPLATEDALHLLDTAVAGAEPVLLPVHIDTAAIRAQARTADDVPPILKSLVRAPIRSIERSEPALRSRLGALPKPDRIDAALATVREQAAEVLGHSGADDIPADQAFRDMGFDSLTSVELRNRLNSATGLSLPATLLFDYPTPRLLADLMLSELTGEEAPVHTPVAATGLSDEPIAIVSMACRYPGGVRSPEDFWRLLQAGRDAVSALPDDRGWDLMLGPRDDDAALNGGFLYDAGEFDAGFFGIGPREATAMDPQQRLLLETSWEVLERAGIDPTSLRGSQTGVFAGLMYHDYASLLTSGAEGAEALVGYVGNGNAGSIATGRVAYVLGLEGPAVTVDTACSSSLVTIHLAAQALRQGECSLALAGGVTVMATPGPFLEFDLQSGLAGDGRCKAFAAAADGTGWSEGVGLVLLERLSDARRNGHEVLAVLRGSAV
ncbi:beta-ketoacyl reductase, partial [Salinispora oceanensis]